MKRTASVVLVLLSFSRLFGQDSASLVWPQPPERARIKHLQTIASMESFQPQKGFFAKVFGFLFGKEHQAGWLVQPVGIAVSRDNVIFVCDPGARGVHILNIGKKEYDFLGGTKLGLFHSPVGCAIDTEGLLYVTDSDVGDIVVLNNDYDPVLHITSHLQRPTGIQVIGGRIYVTDTGRHTVVVFDQKGNFLFEFGHRGAGVGEFNYPTQLQVRDSIAVLDALNYRIQKFDLSGKFGSTFGDLGNVAGRFAAPKSIAFDSDGNYYVDDALMDNIQIFDKSGQLLLIVGRRGNRDGEFMSPSGMFIDTQDKIYLVDVLNKRLQIFQYMK